MTELMVAGVELMFIGMVIVFLFLAMLVLAVHLMTTLVLRFFPEITNENPVLENNSVNKNTIAAIAAAVNRYRKEH